MSFQRACDLFIRDEDMQSVASLMSMGKADIGNLEDLDEDEEEEGGAAVVNTSQRQQVTKEISSITSRLQQLDAHFGNPFEEDDTGWPDDDDDALNPFGDCLLLFFSVGCLCETLQTEVFDSWHFISPLSVD